MKKTSRIKSELERIESEKAYDDLAPYANGTKWKRWSSDDRELLALLFVAQGEMRLRNHERDVVESFDLAIKAAPESGMVYLRIGQAYGRHSRDPSILALAHEKLSTACSLQPSNPEAWYTDGVILARLGDSYQEIGYLREAERCLKTAAQLHVDAKEPVPAIVLSQLGDCWCIMGKLSGEAYDFWMALEYFRSSLSIDPESAMVWSHCGQAAEVLGRLINKPELVQEAIDAYCQALALEPKSTMCHLLLANSRLRLYLEHGDPAAYSHAEQSFKTAVTLDESNVEAWVGWAILLTRYAERQRDLDGLKEAVAKFQKADECEPHNAVILSSWGEALAMLGALTENLHLLRDGTAKVLQAIEIESDNPAIWRIYASCLTEMGFYFNDESYYLDALEKIKIGLRHDETNAPLWAVLGRIYTSLGTLRSDTSLLEEALKYFSKASELYNIDMPPLYNEWGVCLMRLTEATHEKRHVEAAVAKFEKAVRGYDEAISGKGDPEWLYNYGCALDFLGDFTDNPQHYEKAIQVLTHAVALDPTYRHASYNLALAWTHLGELVYDVEYFYRALETFEELVKEDGEDDVVWNEMGVTLINLWLIMREPTHPEKSSQLLADAEKCLCRSIGLGNTQAYYNMASLSSLCGKYDVAIHFLDRAVTADALPTIEDLMHDEWLEELRTTDEFHHFITRLKQSHK
ncbi:MAG: tetratricopeptide repeat protein [Chlamydiales bacterium]|nr:tetratricopeptide repeat protein [Chlamydiales bacterium]